MTRLRMVNLNRNTTASFARTLNSVATCTNPGKMILGADDLTSLNIGQLLKLIPSIGGGAALAMFSWMMLSRKIITAKEYEDCGRQHKEELAKADARTQIMKEERDEWKGVAMQLLGNNERSQQIAERAQQTTARSIETVAVVAAKEAIAKANPETPNE